MSIKLELEIVEVNELLMALQKSAVGISDLANKIKAQGDAQVVAPTEVAEKVTE